jgi:polar amino acid transport system substrate-binding protein
MVRVLLVVLLATAFACTPATRTPEDAFRWGADKEGGGPFISPREDDPTRIEGFEVDLAEALGRTTGRRAEFVQCNWDQMLPLLTRGNIDLAINGYEYTPERAERYRASIPYYVYELGLAARRDDPDVRGWESIEVARPGRRKRIGVLGGSAADRYVTERFGAACEIVRYEGSTEALQLAEAGRLDATVQDLPVLLYYVERLGRFPGLAILDEPQAPGTYVIYARADDGALVDRIDAAIRELYETGELRRIYERYGIWNDRQATLPALWARDATEPAATGTRWVTLERQAPLLLRAAGVTILLAVISMPLAILIGLAAALLRGRDTAALGGAPESATLASRWLRRAATFYVEVVRGTPLAFQLWVVYFVVPLLLARAGAGFRIDEFWSGVVALAINYSAYEAEIFRLGFQAVPRGQLEAGLALGMPRRLAVRRVLLPQAFRLVIPATANDFIALFKDTAVCSVIAVEELSKQ